MNAFILAAGFGTRLQPITDAMPKPLVPVLNVPSLCYTLFLLKEAGISRAIINIHHLPDTIRRFFDEHDFGKLDIVLSEEKIILGTGGGLKKCEKLLKGEEFLLINSDIISDIDISALLCHHRQCGAGGTLALFETPAAFEIGNVGVRDGRVLDFRNMRHTGLMTPFIYTGTAVLGPEIFQHLRNSFSSIVDTGFTGLMDSVGLGCHIHRGFWQDIGTLQSYYRANILDNLRILQLGSKMMPQIGMAPEMISRKARISSGAKIDNAVIGDRCIIEPGAMVTDSVLLPGTTIHRGTIVSGSIAGPGWVIPP
jgi:mannose-1-phosphate guanylyltransferase